MGCKACDKKRERRMQFREQSKLSSDEQKEIRWTSHIPLNVAILKSFPITGVLELGAGNSSTRLFHNMGINYLSIEQDANWITELNLPNIIHYQCPDGYTRSTLRDEIPQGELNRFNTFCLNHKELWSNYLFIDSYAGYRLSSLNGLYTEFSVIAMHDTEPKNDKCYGYSTFIPNNDYLYFKDSTWISHTSFLIKNSFIEYWPKFMDEFTRQCELFANKHKIKHEPKIIKL